MTIEDFLSFQRLKCLKSGKLKVDENQVHELSDIINRVDRLVNKAKPRDIIGQLVFKTPSDNLIKLEVQLNAEYISQEQFKNL